MAYSLQMLDMKGKKVNDIAMSTTLIADEQINQGLIHEYVVMYLANQRQSSANTKTRGEVRRSGRKLYRQKGTGRARVGDAGSPIRRSGGVAMGPRSQRNWSKLMSTKMKRKALLGAMTLKAQTGSLYGLDKYTTTTPSTKDFANLLTQAALADQSILVVFGKANPVLEKSCRNIDIVSYTTAQKLNAYDLMSMRNVLFVEDGYAVLESRLSQ